MFWTTLDTASAYLSVVLIWTNYLNNKHTCNFNSFLLTFHTSQPIRANNWHANCQYVTTLTGFWEKTNNKFVRWMPIQWRQKKTQVIPRWSFWSRAVLMQSEWNHPVWSTCNLWMKQTVPGCLTSERTNVQSHTITSVLKPEIFTNLKHLPLEQCNLRI